MEQINIANILCDCPTGMELDCMMYQDVYFDYVDELNIIHCYIQHETYKTSITFNQYGTPNSDIKSKCVIFPKGKTTWEGFHRPFKDGDVIFIQAVFDWVCIYKENKDTAHFYKYAAISPSSKHTYIVYDDTSLCLKKDIIEMRFATEEEKAKLFQAIEDDGYRWNDEMKTLDKLQEFKNGDILATNDGKFIAIIKKNGGKYYACYHTNGTYFDIDGSGWFDRLASEEEKEKLFKAIKENGYYWNKESKTLEKLPKFKDGDILVVADTIYIYNGVEELFPYPSHYVYVIADKNGIFAKNTSTKSYGARFASEAEKEILFNAIRDNGYHWDNETKTLEKLPKFNDGDVIVASGAIAIFKRVHSLYEEPQVDFYCGVTSKYRSFFLKTDKGQHCGKISSARFATDKEKAELFRAIKDNGYRWNKETKSLEQFPKFKIDNKIKLKGGDETGIITQITDCFYTIKCKNNTHCWPIKKQDDWELVTEKFDVNTLQTFDKVLVRCSNDTVWTPQFFAYYKQNSKFPFVCTYNTWSQCIPYNEDTKHLTNTTDNCNEYYRIWE